MRILIAEDDAVSRHMLARTLGSWGHDVTITNNGIEAWQTLREPEAPKLAILDWMMPELDGIEVCRRLRSTSSTASVYVILLTAMTSRDNVVEGLEAGADDYLTKPFDRSELRVRIQAAARIVELQSSLAQQVKELEQAIRLDDEVDRYNDEIISELIAAMEKSPANVEAGLSFFSATRHLERIADHATNIAEDVVYLVEGEIIRHRPAAFEIKDEQGRKH